MAPRHRPFSRNRPLVVGLALAVASALWPGGSAAGGGDGLGAVRDALNGAARWLFGRGGFGSARANVDPRVVRLPGLESPVLGPYRITSPYGWRRDPFTARPEFHTGVDLAAAWGTPVVAVWAGRVVRTGYSRLSGRFVEIEHPQGLRAYYGHLSKILVMPGQGVRPGQRIGLVGSTGRSTGPHVHFALKKNAHPVDPFRYVPELRRPALSGRP